MKSSWEDISIALAGVMQCAAQVEHIATTGYVTTDQFETAIKSLFVTSPENTLSVYGGLVNLRPGLETLEGMFSNYRQATNRDLFRYALGVIHIQKRLSSKRDVLGIIANRLEHAEKQAQHFGYTHDNLVRNVADIYSDTISKFQYRIQVTGNYNYLQQDRVANQVRALLLAAIRSSMLWRQIGGSRWQCVMYRGEILASCHELIKQAKQQELTATN